MRILTTEGNLNQAGLVVDAAILEYLNTCSRREHDWANPPLADIARMARTSVFVVRDRLSYFTRTGTVVEETRTVGGMEEVGWVVPRKRKGQHKPQTAAAGLNGNDGAFLRSCGILTEE